MTVYSVYVFVEVQTLQCMKRLHTSTLGWLQALSLLGHCRSSQYFQIRNRWCLLQAKKMSSGQCWWQNFLAVGRTFCPMAELLAEPLPVS